MCCTVYSIPKPRARVPLCCYGENGIAWRVKGEISRFCRAIVLGTHDLMGEVDGMRAAWLDAVFDCELAGRVVLEPVDVEMAQIACRAVLQVETQPKGTWPDAAAKLQTA